MKRDFRKYITIGILALLLFRPAFAATNASSTTAAMLSRDELAAQIQTKSKQLDDINAQLEATKQTLATTKSEKATLQKTLNALQNNVNQLNLSIKSDQLTVQKLNLEIDSLNYDIQDIKGTISDKQDAIVALIKQLQQKTQTEGNLLTILLKSGSLADGVLEAQTVNNLEIQLTADIGSLRDLHDQYNQKLDAASVKKGAVANHQLDLKNKQAILVDQQQEKQIILAQTKNKETLYQQKLTELQKQQQQIANEIETYDAVLRTKIDPSTLPALGHGVLALPIDNGLNRLTQGYGATDFAKNGYQGHWHNGVDMGTPIGTPVYAAEDGVVTATGNQDQYCYKGAYGKFIVVNHTNKLTTLYGHLSRQVVAKGDTVKRGQLIGYSGSTGYATGAHLHFTVFAQETFYMGPSKVCGPMPFGGDLNPLGYL